LSGRKRPAKPPRIRLQTDARRAQLLELGMDLFAERGYEDIAIDDLAAAAGISKGLLYHYFRGKREFYVETIRAASLRLRRLSEPDPKLPPVARLRASIDAHLNYIQDHGPAYAAIYRSGVAVAPEVSEILEEHRGVITRHFLRNLGVARPRPVLRAALRAWIGMVEGASLDWIAHPALKRDQLRELLVAGYIATLAKAIELDPRSVPPALFHAAS
jgi:AcrR family transcriptional regulator